MKTQKLVDEDIKQVLFSNIDDTLHSLISAYLRDNHDTNGNPFYTDPDCKLVIYTDGDQIRSSVEYTEYEVSSPPVIMIVNGGYFDETGYYWQQAKDCCENENDIIEHGINNIVEDLIEDWRCNDGVEAHKFLMGE